MDNYMNFESDSQKATKDIGKHHYARFLCLNTDANLQGVAMERLHVLL